jgi:hypothetical protein
VNDQTGSMHNLPPKSRAELSTTELKPKAMIITAYPSPMRKGALVKEMKMLELSRTAKTSSARSVHETNSLRKTRPKYCPGAVKRARTPGGRKKYTQ